MASIIVDVSQMTYIIHVPLSDISCQQTNYLYSVLKNLQGGSK